MRLLEDNTEENLGEFANEFANEFVNTKKHDPWKKKTVSGPSLKLKASVLQRYC